MSRGRYTSHCESLPARRILARFQDALPPPASASSVMAGPRLAGSNAPPPGRPVAPCAWARRPLQPADLAKPLSALSLRPRTGTHRHRLGYLRWRLTCCIGCLCAVERSPEQQPIAAPLPPGAQAGCSLLQCTGRSIRLVVAADWHCCSRGPSLIDATPRHALLSVKQPVSQPGWASTANALQDRSP
jgi:hypothetical protein